MLRKIKGCSKGKNIIKKNFRLRRRGGLIAAPRTPRYRLATADAAPRASFLLREVTFTDSENLGRYARDLGEIEKIYNFQCTISPLYLMGEFLS